MITFKAKLRKIGNSHGVLIPLRYLGDYTINEELTIAILKEGVPIPEIFSNPANKIPEKDKVEKIPEKIIEVAEIKKEFTTHSSSSRFDLCPKHKGSVKSTCGCE